MDADVSGLPKRPLTPCIGVCLLDAGAKYCIGCYRTTDEIAAWSTIPIENKLQIMEQCSLKRKQHRSKCRPIKALR